jgi:hypothetical protein
MSSATVMLLIVVVTAIAALPAWPHSRGWGYAPSGVAGAVLLVVLVVLVLGRT